MKISTTLIMAAALATGLACQHAQANNIFGIDVSSYQGSIDWSDVKANGAVFAFAKATEGNYYEDADYVANMKNGKAAGMQMGAYHFARPDIDCVSTDANYFWAFAGGYILADGKSLDPMVDFEVFDGSDCQPDYTAWFNQWSVDVQAKTSAYMHPVIYCSACSGACDLIQYNESGGITLSAWIADYDGQNLYTGAPWGDCDCCNAWITGCGDGNWTYWQVSSTGSIGGVSGDCDFDAYPLSLADLEAYQGVGE
ncbi:MAG TPA: glycoside hydrolase family 25 protein [Candidatus Sulfotelmatobacter sp.]|nr:glycoside hydrolase family 25 protein [Candidatus Sulfotelmatobacter sp.]